MKTEIGVKRFIKKNCFLEVLLDSIFKFIYHLFKFIIDLFKIRSIHI